MLKARQKENVRISKRKCPNLIWYAGNLFVVHRFPDKSYWEMMKKRKKD